MPMMKAVVMYEPGGPQVLKIVGRPIPVPKSGEVLIRVKAFGLNRSELITEPWSREPLATRPGRNCCVPNGMDQVFIDNGSIAEQIKQKYPKGVDKVLELDEFSPMEAIPSAVCLTTYYGRSEDFMRTPLEDLAKQIAAGTLHLQTGKTFSLDEIVAAHRCTEENKAGGKIVVLT